MFFTTALTLGDSARFSTACLLAFLSCFAPQAAHAAHLLATDDHFEILDVGAPDLRRASLEANDNSHSGAWIEVTQAPAHGTLTSDGAGGFVYHSTHEAAFLADSFRYRWSDGTQTSNIATVSWHVTPSLQPLGGRWPTRTCNDVSCEADGCSDGEGAELGWYDRATGIFSLCDWVDDNKIETCGRYEVHHKYLQDLPTGGRALVVDWDADGWDEPALLDPATGDIWIFEDMGQACPGSCEGHCLDRVAVVEGLESPGFSSARSTPVAGRWEPDSETAIEDVGWIDHAAARAWFPSVDERGQLTDVDAATTVAVAGNWNGGHVDSLAFWNADTGTLDILSDTSGQGIQSVQIEGAGELHLESAAFSARPNGCSAAWLGFFSPHERTMILEPIADRGRFVRAITVDVPADPDGWPQSCSDPDPPNAN